MMQCDDGPSPIGCPLQDVCLPSKGGKRYFTKLLKIYENGALENVSF